ncbi:hypothetical protein RFI_26313 [Reticulomyxa filosa]|uniref:Uncharacterized protein n=1 Tax=Reticulomyxa filosa TaxID=46433 RepID=X6MAM4_RETFI|nr:hypothetical protein RFI_26313 [Reticulomyxa filosa]|eukprot:ETO11063.1 hypothetical protein RFI_26313 [Reticulomyxa filosa]
MSCVLQLFKCIELTPRIEHILICKENTTEEEIECLLFRSIISAKRLHGDMNWEVAPKQTNLQPPLYCLMWPEVLPLETLERVTELFHTLLLSDKALTELKETLYLLVTPNQLIQQLYCNNLRTFALQNVPLNRRPFVQLYVSDQIGIGKSFKIGQDIAAIREFNPKVQDVRVAFNSSTIDWKSVMEGFWRYHPCTNEKKVQENLSAIESKCSKLNYSVDSLIVYHLDISSCVSVSMDTFLFELLFLQHVNIPLNTVMEVQCFHVNSNMAFLIEMPVQLLDVDHDYKQLLRTVFSLAKFPIVDVSKETNPYIFGPEAKILCWEFNVV